MSDPESDSPSDRPSDLPSDPLQGAILYFDCFAGVAGDMALGALLDLGVPEEVVRDALARLPLRGYRFERTRVQRGALMGTKIHVHLEPTLTPEQFAHQHLPAPPSVHGVGHHPAAHHHDHDTQRDPPRHAEQPHAHYRDIRRLLVSGLDGELRRRTLQIFDRLAEVEARLHGVSVEEVTFHEVGAVDSIVDIVGTAAALTWIAPARVVVRTVPLGGGTVETAHGRLPVPAPATLELLRGAKVEQGGASVANVELTTPTGAAIVAAIAAEFGPLPTMEVIAVGWGAGDRELVDRPNLLRIVAGRAPGLSPPARGDVGSESHLVIEANIDDMNPELVEPLVEALQQAGALDVWLQPISMKKGRPGLLVSALCEAPFREKVAHALLSESTTIGVRFTRVARLTLPRRFVDVTTRYGSVPIKVAGTGDEIINAAPEYEVCRRLARTHGVPVKRVYQEALAAFYRG